MAVAVPRERVTYIAGELKRRRTEENFALYLCMDFLSAPPSLPSSAVETSSLDTESALEALIARVTSQDTVSVLEGSIVGRDEGSGNGRSVGAAVGESTGKAVGLELGKALGLGNGKEEGIGAGATDGAGDGARDGFALGAGLGSRVGRLLGT